MFKIIFNKPIFDYMEHSFLNTELYGSTIYLEPLNDTHYESLINILTEDKIWEQGFHGGLKHKPKSLEEYQKFINEILSKEVHMFAIKLIDTHETIGATGVKQLLPNNVTCEIGATAIHVNYWGTNTNAQSKTLLINHLFSNGYQTITFVADIKNKRSSKAILKLGAELVGKKRRPPRPNDDRKWRFVNAYELTQETWNNR
jgi:RimJ/RimL family protein N-acetyltransferase